MAREKEKRPVWQRAAVIGITSIVLLVPFGLYYLFYVLAQQNYFIDRSHRSLEGIGDQITSRIDGLSDVVEKAATKGCPGEASDLTGYFKSLKPFGVSLKLEPQPASSEDEPDAQVRATDKPPVSVEFKQKGSDKVLLLNYEFPGEVPGEATFRSKPFVVSTELEGLLQPAAEKYLIRGRRLGAEDVFDKIVVADSQTGEVVFQYGPDLPIIINNADDLVNANSAASKKTDEKDGENRKELRAKIGRGMSGMIPITVAEIDYKLFFHPIQLTAPKRIKPASDSSVSSAEGSEKKTTPNPGQASDKKSSAENGRGADKKESGGDADQAGYKLTVFGIVRSDYAFRKTIAFTSYMLLLFAVMLVLVVSGSGPLIKLKLLGPKDRLCNRDAVLAVMSAFFVTALLTLGILDAYAHTSIESRLDRQLEQLAGTVSGNLRTELECAVDQLDRMNDELNQTVPLALPECSSGRDLAGAQAPKQQSEAGTRAPQDQKTETSERVYVSDILNRGFIMDPRVARYPYFKSVTWIDYKDGQQQIKFTTRSEPTPFIKVDTRKYYLEAKEGQPWVLPNRRPNEKSRTFFLESVHSMASGEVVAVISKRGSRKVRDDDEAFISAMDTRLLSLYDPVLPAGYGFCVIDDLGKVLFHSDDSKNLLENFIDECRNDRGLRGAVRTRASDLLDLKYLGRDHRAFVTPLEVPPWTLVVFRDKQILRTMNLEAMTLAVYLGLAYATLLAVALAFIFVFLPGSKHRQKMVWPDEQHCARYKRILIVNAALFIICIGLIAISNRAGFIWAILFPLLGISHALWLLGKSQPKPRDFPEVSWLSDWRRLYVLALLSMLAVACVAPTFAFFKLMREEQIKVFLRYGQMSVAKALQEREKSVRSLYPASKSLADGGASNEAFVEERLASTLDVDDKFFFETNSNEKQMVHQEPLGGPLCWFLTLSPLYDEVCVGSFNFARGRATDQSWDSSDEGDSVLLKVGAVTAPVPPSDSHSGSADGGRILRTKVPPFLSLWNPYFWLLIPMFALLLIGAYFAVRFAARRIVLLDLADASLTPISPTGKIEKNYLVIGPASLDRSKLFLQPAFVYLDLKSCNGETWWGVQSRIDQTNSNRPVVLDSFDANREDWKLNLLKLELIENLTSGAGRPVVIISGANPVALPLSDVAAKDAESAKVMTAGSATVLRAATDKKPDPQRWSEALSSFTRRTAVEGDDALSWAKLKNLPCADQLLSKEQTNADGQELVAKEADQLEAYYSGIWATCSPDEKMTLFRVAKDGFVNRFDPQLRPLMQRGLIVRNPALSIRLPSFRVFVLNRCIAENIQALQADEPSHWERWKLPIVLVLVSMIAFLFATQRDLFDNAVYIVTGVTGGVLAILRLIGLFQPKSAGASASQT